MRAGDKVCLAVTSLFGLGWFPLISGTVASVLAAVVAFFIKDNIFFFSLTGVSLILAFALSGRAEALFKEKDSKKIVIDDFAGMLVGLLSVPHTAQWIFIGFIVFRIFDIVKIPPADKLERCPGALGVVGDDLIAGIYTVCCLAIARLFV